MTAPSSAATFARVFLREHGPECAQRLASIAPTTGLTVEDVDADAFDGALVRAVGLPRGTILVNRGIREPGRKLFTVAHELGHYVLPGHDEDGRPCHRSVIQSFDARIARREREANVFAAELTMPCEVVQPLARREPSFQNVDEIATRCGTSLTASTYRIVELSTHALALVWSEAGRVGWYHRSDEFRPRVRVDVLSPSSVAADCFAGKAPSDGWVEVPADAWLYESSIREGATLRESTRHLPFYDATITMLHMTRIIEMAKDYDDPDDGELDPDEFTPGRRNWPGKR